MDVLLNGHLVHIEAYHMAISMMMVQLHAVLVEGILFQDRSLTYTTLFIARSSFCRDKIYRAYSPAIKKGA